MKVAVVGPGAMGCLFAARIQEAGIPCLLVDHDTERAARLKKNGILVERDGEERLVHVEAASKAPTGLDLILVLTKSTATADLRFPPDTPVLTLQNGLGNAEVLASMVGSPRLMAGTTAEGSTLLDEGHIRHAGTGKTVFGAWTSCKTDTALRVLTEAGFDAEVTLSPGQHIWEKAAVNAGINPLTAILDVPNGGLLEVRETRQLMRDLVVEAAKVASTEGYRFEQSLVELAEEVCMATATNISSMLQDTRAGRPTEIEAITGEILRRAQLASLPTPRTRVVYQILRGLESR